MYWTGICEEMAGLVCVEPVLFITPQDELAWRLSCLARHAPVGRQLPIGRNLTLSWIDCGNVSMGRSPKLIRPYLRRGLWMQDKRGRVHCVHKAEHAGQQCSLWV